MWKQRGLPAAQITVPCEYDPDPVLWRKVKFTRCQAMCLGSALNLKHIMLRSILGNYLMTLPLSTMHRLLTLSSRCSRFLFREYARLVISLDISNHQIFTHRIPPLLHEYWRYNSNPGIYIKFRQRPFHIRNEFLAPSSMWALLPTQKVPSNYFLVSGR